MIDAEDDEHHLGASENELHYFETHFSQAFMGLTSS